jgi:hypothetical protein
MGLQLAKSLLWIITIYKWEASEGNTLL